MNGNIAVSKILLPIEFSERCRGAARYAEALACRLHAELTLLHVLPPPYAIYGGAGEVSAYCSITDVMAERLQQAQAQLDLFARELPADLPAHSELLEGDPARMIVEYAHEGHFDLIVMPTHAYGPFRRFLIGSVTAKVLHDVECPVWTGPHLEQAPEWDAVRWRRVVCAVDLGPHSTCVLRWAGGFAHSLGADLVVIHAIPAESAGLGGLTFDPDWRVHLGNTARAQIAKLQHETAVCGGIHIEIGDVPDAVSHAVECVGGDLLVIGRSIGSGVFGRLRGNAYAIIRESPCPVVSI